MCDVYPDSTRENVMRLIKPRGIIHFRGHEDGILTIVCKTDIFTIRWLMQRS